MAALEAPLDSSSAEVRSAARSGLFNLAGAAVSSTTNVLLVLLVTRNVAPDVAGSLFAATSVFLIGATLARLGTTTGLVYWLARMRALGRPDQLGRCLRLGLIPVAAAGVVVGAAMFAIAAPLGRLVGGDEPDIATTYLLGLAAFLPLAAMSDAVLAATRGLGAMRPTVWVERVGRPIAQVLLTVVVLAAATTGLLAAAWAAPYVAAVCVSAIWLVDLSGKATRQLPPDGAATTRLTSAEFWRYTAPRSIGTLVQLALQRLDIVLVAALAGPAEAAIYTAATRFLVVGQLGNHAVSTAVEPRMAGLLAVGDHGPARRLYQVSTGWLILVTWPLYLLAIGFATELTSVFGAGYDAGAPAVVILALAMLLATACGTVSATLNMAGKTVWTLVNAIAALITMVALDLILIPRFGVAGAALAWAVAIAVNNLLPLAQLGRAFALHPFGPESRRAMALAGPVIGIVPATIALAGTPLEWRLAASMLALAVFAALVWRSRRVLAFDTLVGAVRR